MPEATNAELEAQIASIRRVLEERELAPLTALNTLLASEPVADLVEVLAEVMPLLNGERRQQASNILNVLTHSPAFLQREAQMISDRLTPAPAPVPEPAPVVEPV